MAPSDPHQTKFVLDKSRLPRSWYNIAADLPVPPSPYLHPATLEPIGPADLAPLFPMALILQEVSAEREIEIPEPVRDAYRDLDLALGGDSWRIRAIGKSGARSAGPIGSSVAGCRYRRRRHGQVGGDVWGPREHKTSWSDEDADGAMKTLLDDLAGPFHVSPGAETLCSTGSG